MATTVEGSGYYLPGSESRAHRLLNRRNAVMLFSAGTVAASHIGGEILWRSEPTTLKTLPYDGPHSPTAGIAFPGLGSFGGESMARQMAAATPDEQPWGYFHYDNKKGITTDELAEHLQQYRNKIGFEALDMYAPSMGFLLGLEAARKADIPLRVVFMNSSPAHLRDGNGGKLGEFVAQRVPYDFGLIGKFTGTLAVETIREGVRRTPGNVAHAVKETFRGASLQLLRTQVMAAKGVDLEANWDAYSGIIDPDHTKAAYASPLPRNDKVVRVNQGYAGIQRFFGRFGIEVDYIEMPEAQHANTEQAIELGRSWLEQAQRGSTPRVA